MQFSLVGSLHLRRRKMMTPSLRWILCSQERCQVDRQNRHAEPSSSLIYRYIYFFANVTNLIQFASKEQRCDGAVSELKPHNQARRTLLEFKHMEAGRELLIVVFWRKIKICSCLPYCTDFTWGVIWNSCVEVLCLLFIMNNDPIYHLYYQDCSWIGIICI